MLLALALALAADHGFDQRVHAAKALETRPEGKTWQGAMWDHIGNPATDALRSCILSNTPADKRPFTLVANVGKDGHSSDVAVNPQTPVATCFAGQFATWALPVPPAKAPTPYPIEIDVSMDK